MTARPSRSPPRKPTSGLAIEVEGRRRASCATGTASLTASARWCRRWTKLPDAAAVAEAAAGQCRLLRAGQVARHRAARVGRSGGLPNIWREIREADPIGICARVSCHPGVLQRMMNKVLVDNAIAGAVDPRRQQDAVCLAAKTGDVMTARAKVIGNYDRKGHQLRRARCAHRWPMATRRWRIAGTSRSTSRANKRRRRRHSSVMAGLDPAIHHA